MTKMSQQKIIEMSQRKKQILSVVTAQAQREKGCTWASS